MDASVTNYISSLQASTSKYTAEDPAEDGTLRMLLTRIKHANISSDTKKTLRKMVQNIAVNGTMDSKSVKSILDMIFLQEMTALKKEDDETGLLSREKTVNEQMDEIYTARAEKKERQEQIDKLGSLFSTNA